MIYPVDSVIQPLNNRGQEFSSYNLGRIVLEISPAPPFNVGDTNAINAHEFFPQHWKGGRGEFFPTLETKIVGLPAHYVVEWQIRLVYKL